MKLLRIGSVGKEKPSEDNNEKGEDKKENEEKK